MIEQEEEISLAEHPNVEVFADAVEGVETLLEGIVILFEEGVQDVEEEVEQCEEEWEEGIQAETQQGFTQVMVEFCTKHAQFIAKNTVLTFAQGQNIVHLSLRVLGYCSGISREDMGILVSKCFENMFVANPPA